MNVRRAGLNRFYTNVELDASQAVDVNISYENGAKTETKSINWEVTNLFADDVISLRQGDSLLLNALPTGAVGGSAQITYNGQSYTVNDSTNQAIQFNTAGEQSLTATYTAVDGTTQTASLTVKVVAKPSLIAPALMKGQNRAWATSNTSGMELSSAGMTLTKVNDTQFTVCTYRS